MGKKREGDIADSVVFALAGILTVVLLFNLALINTPQPQFVPITGFQTATGTLELYILAGCSSSLAQGWNFVSLCHNVTNNNINFIFSGIDIKYVMRWNETSQEFAIYSPSSSSNPFETMEINRSYMVYLNSVSGSLLANSGQNPNMNITLVPGWSAPSYPYEFPSNFTIYVNETTHRFVMKWNTTTQEYTIWTPRMASPPSSLMFVGDGQFIYSDATNTIRYNRTNLTS